MPCDSGPSPQWLREQQERLDRDARVMCEMAHVLTDFQRLRLSPEAREWIDEHEYQDALKATAERLKTQEQIRREEVLRKLSEEDRRVLGLIP